MQHIYLFPLKMKMWCSFLGWNMVLRCDSELVGDQVLVQLNEVICTVRMIIEPMASQVVLLSAFKLKHTLGFNTMHHDDSWDGSASHENVDSWAVSQVSAMFPPDTDTIPLLWCGWIPAWLGKVRRENPLEVPLAQKRSSMSAETGLFLPGEGQEGLNFPFQCTAFKHTE